MSKHPDNLIDYFAQWFDEAEQCKDVKEATAVSLATTSRDRMPSNRMVLLKGFDAEGFCFYTNLGSRKAQQLKESPFAAMCFYWEPLGKQIRIEGHILPVSDEQADEYFASRPLKSRIGAWASKQSQSLENKADFLKDIAKQSARFVTEEVPRPPFWSGYRLIPNRMEFWQEGEYRLHDRLCYMRDDAGNWQTELLYP